VGTLFPIVTNCTECNTIGPWESDDMQQLWAVLQDFHTSLSSEADSMLCDANTRATVTTTYDDSNVNSAGSIKKFQPGEKPTSYAGHSQ